MRRLLRTVLTIALLATMAGGVRCAAGPTDRSSSGEAPDGAQEAVVSRHVDGDTIWVRVEEPGGPLLAGAEHKIRLLEIDSPEVHPDPECYGAESSTFAQRSLPLGSTVQLVSDREDTDRYGRFLRYVWTGDGTFYNEEAVLQGYATAVLYEPNDAYIERLRAAEANARAAGRGLWGECPLGQG